MACLPQCPEGPGQNPGQDDLWAKAHSAYEPAQDLKEGRFAYRNDRDPEDLDRSPDIAGKYPGGVLRVYEDTRSIPPGELTYLISD